MVLRLYTLLDLQPQRLPERGGTKRYVTVSVQKHDGIAALPRPVIDAHPGDRAGYKVDLASDAEPRIRHA